MSNRNDTTISTQDAGFMALLANRLLAGSYRTAARSLQMEAPDAFARIIAEADPALDAHIAEEVERLLSTGGAPFVRFEQTLMPKMRERFGITTEHLEVLSHDELKAMNKRCNACAEAARCWTALRDGQGADQCREFCPNSGVFEGLAGCK